MRTTSEAAREARMRVAVDREKCCGAGLCVLTAGGVFDQGEEDGLVVLLVAEPPAAEAEDVREAAQGCPCGAITVEETAGQ
ncbi:ferredoxin [Streptomyces physcomitrii]|uniref:ferredoxin n=1 Tax=Streptomyces physcomitrii TaxID=2724184 RepID=UPI003F4CFABB